MPTLPMINKMKDMRDKVVGFMSGLFSSPSEKSSVLSKRQGDRGDRMASEKQNQKTAENPSSAIDETYSKIMMGDKFSRDDFVQMIPAEEDVEIYDDDSYDEGEEVAEKNVISDGGKDELTEMERIKLYLKEQHEKPSLK